MNKRLSYTAKLKLKVTPEAEETNNLVAAYLFDINEQQVCEWGKNEIYQNMLQEKRQMEAKMQFPTLEETLIIRELDKYQY